MNCAWQAYINILPQSLRESVGAYKESLTEIRMRIGIPIELVLVKGVKYLPRRATLQEMTYTINVASKYSPWSVTTVSKGYITAPGGHRIGICGEAVMKNGVMTGISTPTSISVRVARDFPGLSVGSAKIDSSALIIGPPGAGKTTLLRDMIRQKSDKGEGCIAVVDERRELFPFESGKPCFPCGNCTDILSGCSKPQGIQLLLKNMTPKWIVLDEITSPEDCNALMDACWCGVKLLCTAHAESRNDLVRRNIYRPIIEKNIFDWLIILKSDRSWSVERMNICC